MRPFFCLPSLFLYSASDAQVTQGIAMKITVDVDITPEELRTFLGLPDVEKFQKDMMERAQEYLKEAGQSQYQSIISSAMQPMMAYQSWVQKMMNPADGKNDDKQT